MLSTPVPLFSMLGSPLQLLVIGLILLLLFGASRLGEVGKGLGEGIRNFKKGLAGDDAAAKDAAKKSKPVEVLPAQANPQPAPATTPSQKSNASESDQS